ncbi:putative FAE1/Type III polyketide synthase-like protein [Helianthus anomalus]
MSYNSILRKEDNTGITGININKDLLIAAISTIGHHILPMEQKLLYTIHYVHCQKTHSSVTHPASFNMAVEHFIPHVGVLVELQKSLGFSDVDMENDTV